jgi:hypothetical protein
VVAHDARYAMRAMRRSPTRSRPIFAPAPGPARSSRRAAAPRRPPWIPSPRSHRSRPQHGLWLHVDAAMAGSAMIPAGVPLDVERRRRSRVAGHQPA